MLYVCYLLFTYDVFQAMCYMYVCYLLFTYDVFQAMCDMYAIYYLLMMYFKLCVICMLFIIYL